MRRASVRRVRTRREREREEGDESEFEPLVKKPCSTRSGRHHASSIIV